MDIRRHSGILIHEKYLFHRRESPIAGVFVWWYVKQGESTGHSLCNCHTASYLSDVERLRHESLGFACAGNGQLVILGQLIHAYQVKRWTMKRVHDGEIYPIMIWIRGMWCVTQTCFPKVTCNWRVQMMERQSFYQLFDSPRMAIISWRPL